MGITLKIFSLIFISTAVLFGSFKGFLSAENSVGADSAASPEVATSRDAAEEKLTEGTLKIDKEKISLDLKGIDIIELFRILSVKMNLTIVPSKSVSGRVNIFLNNLTFEDVLDVILISQDLACDRKGSIINIMTSGEFEKLYGKKYNEKREIGTIKLTYAKPATVFNALSQIKSDIGKVITDEATGNILLVDIPEKIELMEKTARELDQPLATEVIDLQYAKAADIKTHLTSAITTGPGELYVDERSSKLVVSDLPEKMKKLKRMVKAFDEKSKQVFIEGEIVQITLKDEYQRSINWQKLFEKNLDFKGTFPVAPSFTPSPLLSASSLQAIVGVLSSGQYGDYTATLKILQTIGNTKVLSRPRIAVLNNQEAKILVGSREAYVTQTQSQATDTTVTAESIQFIDVGVKLNVVPTINADGFITMKIKPEVSSVRETLTTALGSTVPIVETSEAETVVKVKDGTMIMIAGLMKEDKRSDRSGIPGLSKLPLVGWLFSTRADLKKRTEVVVFLTPHIISGDVRISEREQEYWFPAEVVPENIEEEMISQRINELKIKPKSVSSLKKTDIQREGLANKIIETKTKGIKEY